MIRPAVFEYSENQVHAVYLEVYCRANVQLFQHVLQLIRGLSDEHEVTHWRQNETILTIDIPTTLLIDVFDDLFKTRREELQRDGIHMLAWDIS